MISRIAQQPWRWCLAAALMVGMLASAPGIIARSVVGDAYQGVPYAGTDNEDEYLTRMQEVVDGNGALGSTFYFEYKHMASPVPPYAEYLYAVPALLLRIPVSTVVGFTKFLFPALLFVLVYALVWRITATGRQEDRILTALTIGALVTLGYEWPSLHVLQTFITTGTAPVDALLWTRPTNPIVGALLLFGLLHAFWSIVQKKGSAAPIVAGILMGAMAFYFFAWAMALSLIVMMGAVYAATKQWSVVRRFGGALAVGVLTLLPGLWPTVSALNGFDPAAAGRNGMFFTHVPLLNKTVLLGIAFFAALSAVAASKEKARNLLRQDWWLFGAGVLAASLWVYTQNIVTGRTVWPYHFVQYTKPLMVITVLIAAFFAMRPYVPRLWKAAMAGLLALALLTGVITASSGLAHAERFREMQRYGPALAWLNTHAAEDCVVLVPDRGDTLVGLVTALTHCDVYLSAWVFSGVPYERVLHDFYIRLRLANVAAEDAQTYLEAHPELIRAAFYETWPQLLTTAGRDAWVDQKIAEVAPGYAAVANEDPAALLNRYRVDYLLTEGREPQEHWEPWGVTAEVHAAQDVTLYAF